LASGAKLIRWNVRSYCQITTRDKSIQSSIVQHQEATLYT